MKVNENISFKSLVIDYDSMKDKKYPPELINDYLKTSLSMEPAFKALDEMGYDVLISASGEKTAYWKVKNKHEGFFVSADLMPAKNPVEVLSKAAAVAIKDISEKTQGAFEYLKNLSK